MWYTFFGSLTPASQSKGEPLTGAITTEAVRGHPDAGERGGTQRKQHLDEDLPRAPLRRAPELPQPHRHRLDSRFLLNMTRIV